PRKLGLHLRNVAAEVVKNFFCRCGDVFWICLERSPVRSKVGKACLLGDDQHLGLDAFHFVKAKLMYFIGGHVRGSAAVNVILVALLPVRKRGDCKSGAALRRVFLADECREALISRDDISVDGIRDLLRQALLIFVGRRNGFASIMPWHCTGTFSRRNRTGISLSFIPARRTSVVWVKTRGI